MFWNYNKSVKLKSVKMRYIVNFQIKVLFDRNANKVVRSSYTILEKEAIKFDLSNISKVESWFKNLFKEKPLDYFIDERKITTRTSLDMKIGRITNSISGKYTKY